MLLPALLVLSSLGALPACASSEPRRERAAEVATLRGDWAVAAERWFAVWEDTRDGHAAVEAGRALLQLGDAASALSMARAARVPAPVRHVPGRAAADPLEVPPQTAHAALMLELEALTRLDRGAEAELVLQEALGRAPRPEHFARLAELRLTRGDELEALSPLRKAVSAGVGGAQARRSLARLESQRGSARAAFELWITEDLRDPSTPLEDLLLAARTARDPEIGDSGRAIVWLERARGLAPQSVEVELELCAAHAGSGSLDAAIASATRAVELDPTRTDSIEALLRLCLERAAQGDRGRAEELIERASQLEPERRADLESLLVVQPEEQPVPQSGATDPE